MSVGVVRGDVAAEHGANAAVGVGYRHYQIDFVVCRECFACDVDDEAVGGVFDLRVQCAVPAWCGAVVDVCEQARQVGFVGGAAGVALSQQVAAPDDVGQRCVAHGG